MSIINNTAKDNINMGGYNLKINIVLILTVLINLIEGNVIVKTSSGDVEGVEVSSILKNEKYYSFMGIPYAEPPLGSLRFMPPKPHPGWDNVLNAKKESKPCAQFYFPGRYVENHGFCGDEDCLRLSIHTPKFPIKEDESYPTIVFLHNEHFRLSHNSSRDFGPDFFMKENVIIVTVNHRLGSLGFLSFSDYLLPGNNGLKDVILALKWLKQNLQNFGGDPNKVTLMGSLDGASTIDILLHSPKAKGLFSGIILQGGTSWSSTYFVQKTKERAIEFSKVLEEEATTSSFLLKRLADVPAIKLTESEHLSVHADEARAIQKNVLSFGPIIEHDHPDAVITELPESKPLDINVPVMIGYNSRSAIEYAERFLQKPQYLTFADRDFIMLFPIRNNYHFNLRDNVYRQVVEEIKEFYFDEAYIKISKPGEFITYLGDIMSFYPVDYTVRKYVNESKAPVYYYTFDYSGELNMRKKEILERAVNTDGTWGASLADELCYLFICNPIRKSYRKALKEEDSEEIKVLTNMVRMWANFARTGNPTPSDGEDFIWKPATKENKECLVISEDLTMRNNLHDERVKFWDELLAKYETMAVDGVVADVKDEL